MSEKCGGDTSNGLLKSLYILSQFWNHIIHFMVTWILEISATKTSSPCGCR